MNKPFSESCEQNKVVIREAISRYLDQVSSVLEIGSGTGQHAIYMAENHPDLSWQTSDVAGNLAGIQAWLDETTLSNLPEPLELDVRNKWTEQKFDLIFTANTFHIMSSETVNLCLSRSAKCLNPGGFFVVYGPFNYNKKYTSASNQGFDEWLKTRDSESGIKDFEWVDKIAHGNSLKRDADIEMPSNNRIIIWRLETL